MLVGTVGTNFNSGILSLKDKKGNTTNLNVDQIKEINHKVTGLGKGTYIVTSKDAWGTTFIRIKEKQVPYEQVIKAYEQAKSSGSTETLSLN